MALKNENTNLHMELRIYEIFGKYCYKQNYTINKLHFIYTAMRLHVGGAADVATFEIEGDLGSGWPSYGHWRLSQQSSYCRGDIIR